MYRFTHDVFIDNFIILSIGNTLPYPLETQKAPRYATAGQKKVS